jgi:hypothetical protein
MSDRVLTFGLFVLFMVVAIYAISTAATKRPNQPADFATTTKCSISDYGKCREGDYLVASNENFIKRGEKSWDTSVMVELCGERWAEDGHTIEDARGEKTYVCRLKDPATINHERVSQYVAIQKRLESGQPEHR